jgi:hypothetical protein
MDNNNGLTIGAAYDLYEGPLAARAVSDQRLRHLVLDERPLLHLGSTLLHILKLINF